MNKKKKIFFTDGEDFVTIDISQIHTVVVQISNSPPLGNSSTAPDSPISAE